ncbi:MAG: beta-N-acetylglucosaminidase domain-containing protein [Clostridia bacterium]|nr:beta-N-acetylglucosaminidase domain-containing protein [Clostridia bacterium]
MIYPVIQKNSLVGSLLNISGVSFSGDFKDTADAVFSDYGINTDGVYCVEIIVSDSKKTTYIDELSRLSDEKYFLTVTENQTVIETATRRGVFRAANTLAKLIKNNELKCGEIEDYPLFKKRGYIEGFYGKTWEREKRLSVMKLMSHYGMNTFFYAPKDDIYHREKWRESYPEKELNELKELLEEAKKNELDFHWCVGPGLTYQYTSDKDFADLINKFKCVYSIGAKNFGLLLDDIPNEFQYQDDAETLDSIVDAHIYLINKTYKELKSFDKDITLTVCPTQYHGNESEYYITKFGKGIPADVNIFWTGAEICSRVLTSREANDFFRSTGHMPLYWDNYPVNDCEMFQEMHLGPLIGRDKELYKHCEGLISNVMEYAECSKIPLMTVADYLWNPVSYNSGNSIRNAQNEILGDKSELFGYIADHLAVSCLSRHASEYMSEKLSFISFLISTGRFEEALTEFSNYIQKNKECLEMLRDKNTPMFVEMKKWVNKFSMCCDLLDAIRDTYLSPTPENKSRLEKLLDSYNSDAVILTGFCLREAAEKALLL